MSEVAYPNQAGVPLKQTASARLAEGLDQIRSQLDRLEARLTDVTLPPSPDTYSDSQPPSMQSPVAHLADSAWALAHRIEVLIERVDV